MPATSMSRWAVLSVLFFVPGTTIGLLIGCTGDDAPTMSDLENGKGNSEVVADKTYPTTQRREPGENRPSIGPPGNERVGRQPEQRPNGNDVPTEEEAAVIALAKRLGGGADRRTLRGIAAPILTTRSTRRERRRSQDGRPPAGDARVNGAAEGTAFNARG